jgi:hypothetical protein
MARPTDVLNGDVNSYVWSNDGWEFAAEGSVCDAQRYSRGQAAAFFAAEIGHFPSVRVWKRYVLPLTRQDAWEYEGAERWADRNDRDWEDAPDEVPANWEFDEDAPVWRFVHREAPGAIPVWVCGEKGSRPPENPRPVKS